MSSTGALPSETSQSELSAQDLLRQVQELEARLRRVTLERQAAYQELDELARFISHDLRAPLRGIDSYSKALLEDYSDQLDAVGLAYLQFIFEASGQAAHLMDQLIYYIRVQRAEMNPQTVDLSQLATDLTRELQNAQPARAVRTEIAPGLAAVGDFKMLRVLLRNLLDNAWKFTSRHAQACIQVGQTHSDGERTFFVRDDGAGFNMDYQAQLFQPFQRLHSSHEFEGAGMGLAIARRIVERHRGRIWAEGSVEAGARFCFTIQDEIQEAPHAGESG